MMVYRSLGLEKCIKYHGFAHYQSACIITWKFAKTYIEATEQGCPALGYVINVAKLRKSLLQALTSYQHIEL